MAKLKNRQRPRLPHESSPLRKGLIALLFIVAAVMVLGGFWLLSKMGPRDVDFRDLNTGVEISEDVLALNEQSIELEIQFEEILALRDAEFEDIAILKEALDLQKQYLDSVQLVDTESTKRYRSLNQRYQDLAGGLLRKQSLSLESQAEALARALDYEAAKEKYREAYDLQDEINERFPISTAYDARRASYLERTSQSFAAEPIFKRSVQYQVEGEKFITDKNWEKAEIALKQAIAIQDKLNREFRGTKRASVSRLEQLRIQLIGIQSGQNNLEIERIESLADKRRAEGENMEAASLYQEAARLQAELNDEYRDSPYASSERVAEFRRKSETAQSFELGRSVERNHGVLKQLLAERRTYEAADVIVGMRRDIKKMKEAYPKSSLNDEELELKIRYLNLVQSDLGFIQDRIYDALLPIPEENEWKILRTEVSQALYSLIMGTNPSRNLGEVNPVDSVSWIEAKSFCERLSWIMGASVRLPTQNEFRGALGRLRYVVLEDHVWSASNAEGNAQPIGKKTPFASGCFDLLGNVSEWLESVDRFETEDALHIGGNAQDQLEVIFT